MSRQSPSPSIHSLRNGSSREHNSVLSLNGSTPVVYSPTPRVTCGESLGALVGTSLTVVGNNTIYTFAGFDQYTDEVYNSLHQLTYSDKDECTWKRVIYTKGRPPAKRNDHSATLWDNKLVIFGGSSEEDEKYHNDIAILDLTTMTWEYPATFGNQPQGRIRHAATIYNNKLYITGGITSSSCSSYPDTLLILDLVTWIWQDPIPFVRRTQHITFVYHHRLYLFGGLQQDMTRTNDLYFIHLDNDDVSLVTHIDIHSPLAPSLTSQRFLQLCGDQLVVVVTPSISQLSSHSRINGGVWTLNMESLQWKCRRLGPHFGTCHWHSFAMAEHGTRCYLFGTEDELPDDYYSKTICLDLTELGIMPEPPSQLGQDFARLLDLVKPDFTLHSDLDGGDVYVHHLVLLARWNTFTATSATVTLSYSTMTLRGFVHYLYKDELIHDHQYVMICDLLTMAYQYDMTRLLVLCTRRLAMIMDVDNVSAIYHAAKQAHQYGLEHQALQYLFDHFGAVSHSDGFRQLPRSLFLEILDEMPKEAAIIAMVGTNGVSNGSRRYGMDEDEDIDSDEDDAMEI
ncbi:hypothetical protein BC941DRAFT_395928 [Chlamydoabsidia padenii]|nr:hypothetical protein BC941DRAFT_395928 [Chlamydoabsidia padenii]